LTGISVIIIIITVLDTDRYAQMRKFIFSKHIDAKSIYLIRFVFIETGK
jgi:hypothetical protein